MVRVKDMAVSLADLTGMCKMEQPPGSSSWSFGWCPETRASAACLLDNHRRATFYMKPLGQKTPSQPLDP